MKLDQWLLTEKQRQGVRGQLIRTMNPSGKIMEQNLHSARPYKLMEALWSEHILLLSVWSRIFEIVAKTAMCDTLSKQQLIDATSAVATPLLLQIVSKSYICLPPTSQQHSFSGILPFCH